MIVEHGCSGLLVSELIRGCFASNICVHLAAPNWTETGPFCIFCFSSAATCDPVDLRRSITRIVMS
jgi:hypothetical protein